MLKSTIAFVKISTKNLSTDHLSYLQKLRETELSLLAKSARWTSVIKLTQLSRPV
jgi:hypothetical protein